MPTEIRTMPSVMPILRRPSSPTAACVIVAGCEIRVSTPPRDSANEHTRTLRSILLAFASDQRSEARHLALGQFVLRMIRQSRIENLLHFFVFREIVSHSAAVAVVLQHAHRQSFHAAQNQPALEGRQNGARGFLKKSEPFCLLGLGADDDTT